MDNQELLQAIGQLIDAKLAPVIQEQQDMRFLIENVTNRNIQLLMEGMAGVNEKFQRLDELEERVEDIQTTVSVLKALTVKK